MREDGLPVCLIRGGTSRGLFVRRDALPDNAAARDAALLRPFHGTTGVLADGVGGLNPVLRKVAVIAPGGSAPDGLPVLQYEFAQVSGDLAKLDRSVECGNIASGVPLFGALHGWAPDPAPGASCWIDFVNTGQRARATWTSAEGAAGALRITFTDCAPADAATALPLGVPRGPRLGPDGADFSVVRGLNTYIIVRAGSVLFPDPLAQVPDHLYDTLHALVEAVRGRLAARATIKLCLVSPDPEDADGVRARALYVAERRSHPSFAVTGAITLALARCIEGTVLHRAAPVAAESALRIRHPEGILEVKVTHRADGLPATVSLDRTCRLILRGHAY